MDRNSDPVVLINLFEVPTGADEQFIAAWEHARDFLAGQDGYRSTELHQSLGPDAEFRFVNVAEWGLPGRLPGSHHQARLPRPGHALPRPSALYQLVTEDPPPTGDPAGVVLINAFEVPLDGDDAFLAAWERTRVFLRDQPGYLATRLHRSLSPQADFRFVNIGRYQSPQAFQAAVGQPGFREAAATIRHRAHPSLYQIVRR